jgi:hypothetical protein
MAVSRSYHNVHEKQTGSYVHTLKDETEAAVASATINSMTIQVYDEETKAPIRAEQSALNANNVTIHATSGLVTWTVQPTDLVVKNQKRDVATVVAAFTTIWSSSTKRFTHEAIFTVTNLYSVT